MNWWLVTWMWLSHTALWAANKDVDAKEVSVHIRRMYIALSLFVERWLPQCGYAVRASSGRGWKLWTAPWNRWHPKTSTTSNQHLPSRFSLEWCKSCTEFWYGLCACSEWGHKKDPNLWVQNSMGSVLFTEVPSNGEMLNKLNEMNQLCYYHCFLRHD